jgi:hypothetical protein
MDNVRAALARIGMRPYRVFLVWTYTMGSSRGDAYEREYQRMEILPQPKLDGLDSQQRTPTSAGILPEGQLRVSRVSVDRFDYDMLVGNVIPAAFKTLEREPKRPGTFDFYYEIYEDGRTPPPLSCVCPLMDVADPFVPGRTKWRVSAQPERRPFQWRFALERISEDAQRSGLSAQDDHDIEPPIEDWRETAPYGGR